MSVASPGYSVSGFNATVYPNDAGAPDEDRSGHVQAAIDAVAANIAAARAANYVALPIGRVFLPDNLMRWGSNVYIDSDLIELTGKGSGTWIQAVEGGNCRTLLTTGIKRPDPTFCAATRPTGGGFKPVGGAKLFALGTPLDLGKAISGNALDNYKSARKLVVEMEIVPGSSFPRGIFIAGIGSFDQSRANPFLIGTPDTGDGDDGIKFVFSTADGEGFKTWQFRASYGTGGLFKFTVDLAAGTVEARRAGTVVTTSTNLGAGWGPGLYFRENIGLPFMVNDRGETCPTFGPGLPAPDYTLKSFAISLDDQSLASLDFTGPNPAEVRIAPGSLSEGRVCYANVYAPNQFDAMGLGNFKVRVANLRITGQGLGCPFLSGYSSELSMENVEISGGAYGYSTLGAPAGSYTTRLRSIKLGAKVSCLRSFREIITVEDVMFDPVGRWTILTSGTKLSIRHWLVAQPVGNSKSFLYGYGHADGNQWEIEPGNHNFESFEIEGPMFEIHGNQYLPAYLMISGFNGCHFGTREWVRLVNPPNGKGIDFYINTMVSTDDYIDRPTVVADAGCTGTLVNVNSRGRKSARVVSPDRSLSSIPPGSPCPIVSP